MRRALSWILILFSGPVGAQLGSPAIQALLEDPRLSPTERRQLSMVARAHGAQSLETANLLSELLVARIEAGELTGVSLDLALATVAMREDVLGPDHPSLAPSLDDLGYLLHVDSDLERAWGAYAWSRRVREKAFGEDSPEVAKSLAGLGTLEADLGRPGHGEELLRRSVRLLEQHYGRLHPEVAPSLFRLANLVSDLGRFEEATALWQQTYEIFRLPEFRDDKELARSLHNLGLASRVLGRLSEAEQYLQEALELRLGAGLKQAASTYTSLAELMHELGDLTLARKHYQEALAGIRDWFGEDPFRYAETQSRLGLLLEESGEWEEAVKLQEKSLAIRLAKLGKTDDPRVARTAARLGSLLFRMGRIEEAEPHLRNALRTQEATLGPLHPELAPTLTALARLEESRGNLAPARRLVERSVSILEKVSPEHPALVEPLGQLARLLASEGDGPRAARRLDQGLEISTRTFGELNPRAAGLLYERARLLARRGETAAAVRSALEAQRVVRDHVRVTIEAFSERQALNFVGSRQPHLDLALSLLVSSDRVSSSLVREAWDSVILSRALVLETVAARNRVLREAHDPELGPMIAQLTVANRRLAGLLVRSADVPAEGQKASQISRARESAEVAERRLADSSEPLLRDLMRRNVGFDEVAANLPAGSALVAIVGFDPPSAASRYLAFVLLAADQTPRVLDLGPADQIDEEARRWRKLIPQGFSEAPRAEAALRRAGEALRKRIWDPLAPMLEDVGQLFFVPDGSLNLVNLSALPVGSDRYLIEEGPVLHLLDAERDVVALEGPGPLGVGLLAMGGPDFDELESLTAVADSGRDDTRPAVLFDTLDRRALTRRSWTPCLAIEERYFEPLPGARREVGEISQLWQRFAGGLDEPLVGVLASEGSFKRLAPGRRVLHLATHGFFVSSQCSEARSGAHGWSRANPEESGDSLIGLSGLALAGANRRRKATDESEDGMLTAREIAGLDLSGVEWAVLSGCHTGVGDVLSGEGTFGLRRAFIVAGARTVIMSLWTVEDENARDWMRALYVARLQERADTAHAVTRASRQMLSARRQAGKSSHPLFWASFVASGDWR